MFKDAANDTKEAMNEVNRLPDEVVDRDRADELPDEVVDRDGTDELPDEVVDRDGTDELPDEAVDRDGAEELPDEAVDRDGTDELPDEAGLGDGSLKKIYIDDNGAAYREGDQLIPNKEYDVNGYHYQTDEKGRISQAEGQLRIKDPEYTRNMESVRYKEGQEYGERDDRGHLIGHQFGGSDRLENLVPMDAKLNQGDFKKLEDTFADALKDGADVRLKVEPVYGGDSTRPVEFKVSYSIDGEKDVIVFQNESEVRL